MKKGTGVRLCIAIAAMLVIACSDIAESSAHHNFILVGSTACDPPIRSALGIPAETKCDFIRWNLTLDPGKGNFFTLNANYGESQPNTNGFIGGGQRIQTSGKFEIVSSTLTGESKREIYRLTKDKIHFSLVKLNSNLFHLLMPDGSMMIGNGGWSYTLNRKPAIAGSALPSGSSIGLTRSPQLTFDGRTPCAELASLVPRPADMPECVKIKWRIVLNRDPVTLRPSTFTMLTPITRREPVAGTWSESVIGDAVVYRLLPAEKARAFSLLAVDDSLLFFIDDNNRPLVGNDDFSFTLNRIAR